MYEVSGGFEVLAEVKTVRVFCRDAEVNTSVSIKALVSDAALLGVCCVQDMSDAQVMQCLSVLRHSPGGNTRRRREEIQVQYQ